MEDSQKLASDNSRRALENLKEWREPIVRRVAATLVVVIFVPLVILWVSVTISGVASTSGNASPFISGWDDIRRIRGSLGPGAEVQLLLFSAGTGVTVLLATLSRNDVETQRWKQSVAHQSTQFLFDCGLGVMVSAVLGSGLTLAIPPSENVNWYVCAAGAVMSVLSMVVLLSLNDIQREPPSLRLDVLNAEAAESELKLEFAREHLNVQRELTARSVSYHWLLIALYSAGPFVAAVTTFLALSPNFRLAAPWVQVVLVMAVLLTIGIMACFWSDVEKPVSAKYDMSAKAISILAAILIVVVLAIIWEGLSMIILVIMTVGAIASIAASLWWHRRKRDSLVLHAFAADSKLKSSRRDFYKTVQGIE